MGKPELLLFRYRQAERIFLGLEMHGKTLCLGPSDVVDISSWIAQEDPVGWLEHRVNTGLSEISGPITLFPPVDLQEVWASGVTYLRSKVARMDESEGGGDFYDKVYDAARPELFFKSTANRVVGDKQPIRIRRDSNWNVPEPELVLVISPSGKVVGYTIGNDVSSRSIEGENPLYLPQAKVYDGSCAIGPAILVKTDGQEKHRAITMTIVREGREVFAGEVSTERITRTEEDLAEYLFRELTFEHGVFLFTGTGIVPPDDFTLASGDVVRISIEGIGTLENPVE